jgi:MFS family permease
VASEAPALTGAAALRIRADKVRWGGLSLLALTIFSGLLMQGSLASVQETIKHELGLSDFQTSLLQGLAVSIPVALLAIPLGRLTDRGNRMRLLIAMAMIWTIGTALTAFAQGFGTLFAARVLANIGAVLAIPIVISLGADLSPPARRGRALLPMSLGKIAGQAGAVALGGALVVKLAADPSLTGGLAPWRTMHIAFAILSAVLLLPLLLAKEPARREVDGLESPPFKLAMAAIWQRRDLLVPLFIGQVTVVMADFAALSWSSTVLVRDYHQQPADYAGWLGLVILLSGVFGSLIGGFAADAGHRSRMKRGILIGAVVAAALSIPGAFFPIMPTATGFAIMLALLALCGTVTGLVTATALAVLIPNEIRGVCLGAFMVVGSVIGLGVAPTMATGIADLLGGEAYLRYGLTITTAATSLIAVFGFLRAMRRG